MSNQTDDETLDERLAIRCQLGDAAGWEELVQRWNPRLQRFLSRMLADPRAVEDLSQVIWLKIVRSLPQLDDPGKAAAWMYRIARATVADHLRKEYRSPTVVSDDIDTAHDDCAIEHFVESDRVAGAMRHLHPADREALILHYFEHLSVLEVAEVCGVPAGTIKSRMNRARRSLRKHLET